MPHAGSSHPERARPHTRCRTAGNATGRTTRLAAIAIAVLLSGCSIDGVGFARTDVIQADGAMVIRKQTYGVDLRTSRAEAGVAFGYTSTLRIVPNAASMPEPGAYPFGLSTRNLPATATIRRVAGIEVGTNPHMIGVMLGFSEDAIFTRIPEGTSIVRRLILHPDDPARTVLRLCEEAAGCE